MATQFNTIHVFGYGETQIISKDVNKKKSSKDLTNLAAFVDHIKTFKPADVVLTDYHVIHIFNNMDVRYLGNGTDKKEEKTSFSVKLTEVNPATLSALVDEVAA